MVYPTVLGSIFIVTMGRLTGYLKRRFEFSLDGVVGGGGGKANRGDVAGGVVGGVAGDVAGGEEGDVAGGVDGDVAGGVEGDVSGDVTCGVAGDVAGDVTGAAANATEAQTWIDSW